MQHSGQGWFKFGLSTDPLNASKHLHIFDAAPGRASCRVCVGCGMCGECVCVCVCVRGWGGDEGLGPMFYWSDRSTLTINVSICITLDPIQKTDHRILKCCLKAHADLVTGAGVCSHAALWYSHYGRATATLRSNAPMRCVKHLRRGFVTAYGIPNHSLSI